MLDIFITAGQSRVRRAAKHRCPEKHRSQISADRSRWSNEGLESHGRIITGCRAGGQGGENRIGLMSHWPVKPRLVVAPARGCQRHRSRATDRRPPSPARHDAFWKMTAKRFATARPLVAALQGAISQTRGLFFLLCQQMPDNKSRRAQISPEPDGVGDVVHGRIPDGGHAILHAFPGLA